MFPPILVKKKLSKFSWQESWPQVGLCNDYVSFSIIRLLHPVIFLEHLFLLNDVQIFWDLNFCLTKKGSGSRVLKIGFTHFFQIGCVTHPPEMPKRIHRQKLLKIWYPRCNIVKMSLIFLKSWIGLALGLSPNQMSKSQSLFGSVHDTTDQL